MNRLAGLEVDVVFWDRKEQEIRLKGIVVDIVQKFCLNLIPVENGKPVASFAEVRGGDTELLPFYGDKRAIYRIIDNSGRQIYINEAVRGLYNGTPVSKRDFDELRQREVWTLD